MIKKVEASDKTSIVCSFSRCSASLLWAQRCRISSARTFWRKPSSRAASSISTMEIGPKFSSDSRTLGGETCCKYSICISKRLKWLEGRTRQPITDAGKHSPRTLLEFPTQRMCFMHHRLQLAAGFMSDVTDDGGLKAFGVINSKYNRHKRQLMGCASSAQSPETIFVYFSINQTLPTLKVHLNPRLVMVVDSYARFE